MRVFLSRTFRSAGVLVLMCSFATAAAPETATSKIVNAANKFLSTLDEKQRQRVLYAFDDAKQRP